MIRISMRNLAVLIITASVAPLASAQQCTSCQPTCAVPQGPMCALPPCDPTCAVPSECSTGGNGCNTCYQPQQVTCEPQHHGLFRNRPMFNWTKIHIENREQCCQPQAQCCQTAQPTTMAMPMMTMQPVQLQMTAYQPMMAAPQFVQAAPQIMAAPQFVQAAPQFVQAAPQFVQAAPQYVQAAPQFLQAAPQSVQQVVFRPAADTQSTAQTASDDCNLNNVCSKLNDLRKRVDELSAKVSGQKDNSELERRVTQLEESGKLQTEILQEMKTYFEKNPPGK